MRRLRDWWRRLRKGVREYVAEAEREELNSESAFPREDPKEHKWLPANAEQNIVCARCGQSMTASTFMFLYSHGALERLKCEPGVEAVPAAGHEVVAA